MHSTGEQNPEKEPFHVQQTTSAKVHDAAAFLDPAHTG